jgi:hypothetical protein
VFISRLRTAPQGDDLAAWIMADVNHFAAHALVAWLMPWLEKHSA